MKATGIVRRIDDLGRVVIPKEIRRTLRIKEGTPLELFAKEYAEALAQATGMIACITDHDQVVAAAGQRSREFAGKEISRELDRVISDREMRCFHSGERGKISLVENQKENAGAVIVQPIICAGDAIGSVVILAKDGRKKPGELEQKMILCAAGFLGRQMEQ